MIPTLRPYQSDLKAGIYQSWQAGNHNTLAVLPTGGGKSVVMSDIVREGHEQGMTECVIAHRNELVGQMSLHIARQGIKHRIIASKASVGQIVNEHRREFNGRSFINPDSRCAVASVDTLIAPSRAATLAPWALQVNRWTIDECFPAGTTVSTPTGEKPIETLREGDVVTAFDERTGRFHPRKIQRLFCNPRPKNMVRIDTAAHHVLCTPGHPFWTARGWVEAIDLTLDDEILTDDRTMHDVWRTSDVSVSGSHQTVRGNRSGLLQQEMQRCVPVENLVRDNGPDESQTCVGTNEEKQPDEMQRVTRKNAGHSFAHQASTETTRRQRQTTHRSGTTINRDTDSVRICATIADTDGLGQESWADTLQTRYGTARPENMHRSRRSVTPVSHSTGIRRPQRRIFTWQRVDCIEIHQRSDFERDNNGFVYNIEVDALHTYVANGIVVHNCHHVLKTNKWGRAVTMFPNAYGLGVTATPQRADGMGLGAHHDGVFHDMILGPSMRELIDGGSLCDYEIAVPESDFEIDDSTLAPSGDWSTKRMREASKRSHIVGDVVVEYQRRAPGKRAICFATDVETSGEIAARFNAAGITAASVSAKTPTEVRNEYIRRFRDGRITVLVNVDLFGEGFDVPAVEVVIMARPTASLAVYLQQFGRALRVLAGKSYGLVIDHVSNWKRHGFPDKLHLWTLDRREKRARQEKDPDDIELTVCRSCSRPYERFRTACPHCGAEPPVPDGGARSIDQVDGDLMLLTRDKLAELRAAMQLEAPADVARRVGAVAGEIAGRGQANRMIERHQSQQRLREAIEQWAGIRMHGGDSEREVHRRFYLTTGVDVLTAMGQSRPDMDALAERVEGWYNG